MKKYYEYGQNLYMVFVDFKQTYDSVNRQQLWTALKNVRIPEKLIRMIEIRNSNTFCKVRYRGKLSDQFETKSGLRQGDVLSPILFNLALEKVVRGTEAGHEMKLNGKTGILAYANDIIILGYTKNEIRSTTESLINSSKKMGLSINEDKTKYLIMSRNVVNKSNLRVGPYCFEQVDNFKYLGVNINDKNNMHNEIQITISAANQAYFTMNKMLSSKMLSKTMKQKLYTCYLLPVSMYACKTWSTTQGDEDKLLTFERKVLR